ncbi:phosphoenolpyruvate carboxylase, partial [Streptomyces sp. NPDC048110]|uniref:phosphoenolpyruvate carboxylase n=1 Tax=Streptomyces sp. NPDC048110 TaxID=3155483 RepID=UPI0033F04089
MTPGTYHAALQADIQHLADLLDETLVRQEGPELLDLVDTVRRSARENGDGHAKLLRGIDARTAALLVRAFSTYFHLANVTEQVHRGRELRSVRERAGAALARVVQAAAREAPDALIRAVEHLNVRPVFTAHPTEAARRSVLTKLRCIAGLLQTPVAEADHRRHDARLAESIDLLWQTDELRVVRPEPADEARNAIYYLDELHLGAV